MNNEKLSCLILANFNKFSFNEIVLLLQNYKNFQNIVNNNNYNLNFSSSILLKLKDFNYYKRNFNLNSFLKSLKEENINFICFFENKYPKLLQEIYNPPIVLFYKGNIDLINSNCLAVIGSRKNSVYGKISTQHIIKDLKNLCIVSGLALGIDTIAHQNAIKYNLNTIAVLGSGIDNKSIYPKNNLNLAKEILRNNGLLLSEYPPYSLPLKNNFRMRNRIISGLSKAILIIEAKERSGTKITANYALEQNRDILAVPGSIFFTSSFTSNYLISQGAKLITSGDDINHLFNSYLTEP